MKFLTVFAFACVATFVVLHGVYGSPLPAPNPEPSPDPKADPAPKAEPAANPEPVANPNPGPGPNPSPAVSPSGPNGPQPAGGDANFVALSANGEVPSPEAAPLKMDDATAA